MWISNDIVSEVSRVATIFYVDKRQTKTWNDNRRDNELRMFTGWAWIARGGEETRQGMKTQSVAIRDAYYALIAKTVVPNAARRRAKLRLVKPSQRRAA